jgi:hypothetical protein
MIRYAKQKYMKECCTSASCCINIMSFVHMYYSLKCNIYSCTISLYNMFQLHMAFIRYMLILLKMFHYMYHIFACERDVNF